MQKVYTKIESIVGNVVTVRAKDVRLGDLALVGDSYATVIKLDKDMVYTRYADDLLISSKNKFHQNIKEIVDNISAKLKDYNLTLSEHKTRYGTNAGRNWNLGIMYNKDNNLTVGYRQKKLFKNILHNAETGKIEVTEEFKNKLQGQLAYAAYIEPEYFAPFIERVRNL